MTDVAVIGGGAAGMMAAYAAAQSAGVVLLERNDQCGKKLFITGKGRCNITNACDTQEFFANIVRNPKFLMSSLHRFSNTDLIDLLEKYDLQTKVERGNRVFPASDKSNDVLKAFRRMLEAANVEISLNTAVREIVQAGEGFSIVTDGKTYHAAKVVIATGGVSYPRTGSTGDGYRWAQSLGHTVAEPRPALVPLEDAYNICQKMQGLGLRNIKFTLYQQDKAVYAEQGELLFTHFGISGPVVLSASSYIDYKKDLGSLYGEIDLKPALTEEQLDARILRDMKEHGNKQLKTYMAELLPGKLIVPFLHEAHLDAGKRLNEIKREERKQLISSLKAFRIKISGTRPIEEAIVTMGGIDVREINPSTMESKLVKNLYFAGEIIDVSALTGGFNLQIAFSTGHCAGIINQ